MQRTLLTLALGAMLAAPAFGADTEVNGLNIHYTVAGAGPTIIFVHGYTADETNWRLQVPAFVDAYQVATLDLPGHGQSDIPAPDEFSMDLFAAAVDAVRAEIGADRIVLVGHSMGAVVIRQYALNYPDHVAGLVSADGPLDVRSFAAAAGAGGQAPMTLEARTAMLEGMFVPETPEALRAEIRAVSLGAPEATANGAGAAMFDPAIQSDELITAPALTIFAGQPTFPADPSTKEMLPNWESTQIEGTGHFLMMEKPDAFNALLADFLDERAAF